MSTTRPRTRCCGEKIIPRQYDSYRRTVDTTFTKYGGSEAFQHLDRRSRSWRRIFAGYAFAIDYREERGHAYMLSDQRETERVHQFKQPGSCLQCHASIIPAYIEAGLKAGRSGRPGTPRGADSKGFRASLRDALRRGHEARGAPRVVHRLPRCRHDEPARVAARLPQRHSRPRRNPTTPRRICPSIERWRREGRQGEYQPNMDATRQEMRSLVCAQCHNEYYFKGENKLVTHPWNNGLRVEQIEAYYDQANYKDWTHQETGAPVLKAQHPEFEMWSQGIHARSGVACADCHMPYQREGAIKVSNHHVRSPSAQHRRGMPDLPPHHRT